MDLFEAQKDSVLGLINEIFVKGEFTCPVKDPVCTETEEVIGEMTDYEKAIMLARNAASDRFNAMVDAIGESESEPDLAKLHDARKVSDLLNNLLWRSIELHLKDKDTSSIGIRQDWKIVAITRKKGNVPEKCQKCEKLDNCPIAVLMED